MDGGGQFVCPSRSSLSEFLASFWFSLVSEGGGFPFSELRGRTSELRGVSGRGGYATDVEMAKKPSQHRFGKGRSG